MVFRAQMSWGRTGDKRKQGTFFGNGAAEDEAEMMGDMQGQRWGAVESPEDCAFEEDFVKDQDPWELAN